MPEDEIVDDKQETEDELLKDESSTLNMSDEDFMNAAPPAYVAEPVESAEPAKEDKAAEEEDEKEEEEEEVVETEEAEEEAEAEELSPEDKAAAKDEAGEAGEKKKAEPAAKEDSEIDYKAEYEKVMGTFRANGVDMTPKSPEDVRQLMQMGANYHKKMSGLKPSMKILKLLEKNELMDPEKLNYLIDLNAKDPAAITKLLKDSGLDPLDLDIKKDTTYKPTSRTVDDTEIDLDQVLASIKGTPTYDKTLNVITEKWDDASRNIIAGTPQVISTLNGHIADGTYDKVMGIVEYERSLGNLQGISDLEAYRQTGESLLQAGKLNQAPSKQADPAKAVKLVEPKKKSDDGAKLKAKKKAAGPTGNGGKTATPSFNPLEMSDEEIMRFDESKLPTD